jgi:hypothetical protein
VTIKFGAWQYFSFGQLKLPRHFSENAWEQTENTNEPQYESAFKPHVEERNFSLMKSSLLRKNVQYSMRAAQGNIIISKPPEWRHVFGDHGAMCLQLF